MPDAQMPYYKHNTDSSDFDADMRNSDKPNVNASNSDKDLSELLEETLQEARGDDTLPFQEFVDEIEEEEVKEETYGFCADCNAPLEMYEEEICLACEDARYQEHGIDDWM